MRLVGPQSRFGRGRDGRNPSPVGNGTPAVTIQTELSRRKLTNSCISLVVEPHGKILLGSAKIFSGDDIDPDDKHEMKISEKSVFNTTLTRLIAAKASNITYFFEDTKLVLETLNAKI
jgi:hypothetical protein